VKSLYLTHISRRYSPSQVLAEAQPIFAHTVVARDLEGFRLTRGEASQAQFPAGEKAPREEQQG